MVDALDTEFSSTYHSQQFSNFNVRGQAAGLFKNAGTFSYLRFFGAGHEVPAYKVGSRFLEILDDLLNKTSGVPSVLEKLRHKCSPKS
jgi:carboxypeptidase C (cathepsin A)